jgi:N6-L-threonylcarbamoyladenine synthase
MIILGIDTSCDDTAVALLEVKNSKIKTLSNVISSQVKVHQPYGGVYPALAKREHQKNILPVLKKACSFRKKTNHLDGKKEKILASILKREPFLLEDIKDFFRKNEIPDIDALAVTIGPGLEPALWVGINFTKSLSFLWKKPVIPVNHIEGHLLSNALNLKDIKKFEEKLPAIALIVSGGHTQLVLIKKIGHYQIIGETRDDAAGECFDKTARILGLPYPGGPAIAQAGKKAGKEAEELKISLPRPMFQSQDYDFSFSGLKTAVLYDYKKRNKRIKNSKKYTNLMAREIEQAIIDVLVKKSLKAVKDYGLNRLMIAGGVSANKELRKQLKKKAEKSGIELLAPPIALSTDNALMIALAGYWRRKEKIDDYNEQYAARYMEHFVPYKKIAAKANLRI